MRLPGRKSGQLHTIWIQEGKETPSIKAWHREKGSYRKINVDPVRIEREVYVKDGVDLPVDDMIEVNFYPAKGTYPIRIEGNLLRITALFAELSDKLKEIARGNHNQPPVVQSLRPQETPDPAGDVDGTEIGRGPGDSNS